MKGGQVIGATNPRGDHPAERPLAPADIWATVYRGDHVEQGETVGAANCGDQELDQIATGPLDTTKGSDIVAWLVVRHHHEPEREPHPGRRGPALPRLLGRRAHPEALRRRLAACQRGLLLSGVAPPFAVAFSEMEIFESATISLDETFYLAPLYRALLPRSL